MTQPSSLPATIPLFPLTGALLLPRARLPLHIFEPRYLRMLNDAMATPQRLIGMIQPRPMPVAMPGRGGTAEAPAAARLNAIGCAGRVTAFSETEDGRYMITLTGCSRFRLRGICQNLAPYITAEVDWTGFERDLGAAEADAGMDRKGFFALLNRYFSARQLATDWRTLEDAEDELLLNSLSMLLPFDAEDKQALLEAPSLANRRETLVTLVEFALRGGGAEEERRQ